MRVTQMSENQNVTESGKHGMIEILKRTSALLAAIVLVFGTYRAFTAYVESRIRATIETPAFLEELSRRLRPAVVFDDAGSILADMGGMKYIGDIRVSKAADGHLEVLVSPTEHLGVEPILQPMDGNFNVLAERGKKYDWLFRLYGVPTLLVDQAPERKHVRFRLEIVR